ncbi:MAG: aldehyde dehydrogenase family protein [Variovorax sp.]
MAYETKNPYAGELLERFPDATDSQIAQAIADAHHAFLSWRETSFAERAAMMRRAAGLLREDAANYARLLTLEVGQLVSEATAEMELSAAILDDYAEHAAALLAPEKLRVADPAEGVATFFCEPLGVLLAIEPWNFPYYQIARIAAPQLSAGKALKKSTMELGGACAFIVRADADLDKTSQWAVFGRHWNGGQVCVSRVAGARHQGVRQPQADRCRGHRRSVLSGRHGPHRLTRSRRTTCRRP